MLVGVTNLNSDELLKHCGSAESLIQYSVELVPTYFRHQKAIVDNQRYLVAVYVRNLFKNDYNKWHPLCEGLLEGVHITGTVTNLYSCTDLLEACDTEILYKYIDKAKMEAHDA